MTHVFIINPTAGKMRTVQGTLYDLQLLSQQAQRKIKVYVTERRGHATALAREAATTYHNVRVYACGGDGTINEVLQGLIGQEHAEFGCIPIGSGNDFIKNFDKNDFLDLEAQMDAPSVPVDIIQAQGSFGTRYSLNVISFSWDSRVAIEVETFKKVPLVKGSLAYGLSVINQLVRKEDTGFSMEIDGEYFPEARYMIGMCANGGYYGGGFHGAPFSKLNNGMFEVIAVNTITRRQVARLFPKYQKGEHLTLNDPLFEKILTYRQGRKLTLLSSTEPLPITIDGEAFYSHELICTVVPQGIRLILPGDSGNKMLV